LKHFDAANLEQITALSTTDAIGWQEVCNRLRFSDEAPIKTAKDFLPWLKLSEGKELVVSDRSKEIAKKLQKAKVLPGRVESLLVAIGVLSDGK
jgi:hypothetical protein